VALDDVVRIYEHVLVSDVLSEVVNAVGPQEQTNAEFTKVLGKTLHRPTVMPLPGFILKLIMGGEKAKETVLISQRVSPRRLLDAGFEFTHPKIDSAIEAALAS
jgi:NAD dependent epimerase/dehydratase family enzyme